MLDELYQEPKHKEKLDEFHSLREGLKEKPMTSNGRRAVLVRVANSFDKDEKLANDNGVYYSLVDANTGNLLISPKVIEAYRMNSKSEEMVEHIKTLMTQIDAVIADLKKE